MSNEETIMRVFPITKREEPPPQSEQDEHDQPPDETPPKPQATCGFFRDQNDEPFARIVDVDGTVKVVGVRTEKFKNALVRAYYRENGEPPKVAELKRAIMLAIAEAEIKPKVLANLRVAEDAGKIYYDLANDRCEVVEIDRDGWRVITDAPVFFRRYPITGEQVRPDSINRVPLGKIFDFVNLQDPNTRVLCEVYIVVSFFPGVRCPLLVLNGHQGSAKTTAARVIQKLLDPSAADIVPIPDKAKEIAQLLAHHRFVGFDNLTEIKSRVSDLLCQAVTGGVFKKRRLYTDEEDVVLKMDGVVAVTGINIVAERPDLLDRALLFRLERVHRSRRVDEATLWQEFEKNRPGLLATIFSTISDALVILPKVKVKNAPRMADFYRVGIAVSRALGYKNSEFEKAVAANSKLIEAAVIDGDPLVEAVVLFMQHREAWEGTATELLQQLLGRQANVGLPKAPNQLSRKLKEIELNLRKSHIWVFWGRCPETNLTTIELKRR